MSGSATFARTDTGTERGIHEVHQILRSAREEPFHANRARSWARAVDQAVERLRSTIARNNLPAAWNEPVFELLVDLRSLRYPSIADFVRISELLATLELEVAASTTGEVADGIPDGTIPTVRPIVRAERKEFATL